MCDLEKECYVCRAVVTFGPSTTLCDTVLCDECAKLADDQSQQDLIDPTGL